MIYIKWFITNENMDIEEDMDIEKDMDIDVDECLILMLHIKEDIENIKK